LPLAIRSQDITSNKLQNLVSSLNITGKKLKIRKSTIVGRLVDIDSLNEPIVSDSDSPEPIAYEYRPTPVSSSKTAGKDKQKQKPAAAAPAAPDIVKPDIPTKNTASGQTGQIRGEIIFFFVYYFFFVCEFFYIYK